MDTASSPPSWVALCFQRGVRGTLLRSSVDAFPANQAALVYYAYLAEPQLMQSTPKISSLRLVRGAE